MDNDKILKVLKIERECIRRQTSISNLFPKAECNRNCADCDLCLPDDEILEVLDFLIGGYELLQNEGAESYMIKCTEPLSEEQIARFKGEWGNASFTARFEPISLPDNLKAVILGEKGDND